MVSCKNPRCKGIGVPAAMTCHSCDSQPLHFCSDCDKTIHGEGLKRHRRTPYKSQGAVSRPTPSPRITPTQKVSVDGRGTSQSSHPPGATPADVLKPGGSGGKGIRQIVVSHSRSASLPLENMDRDAVPSPPQPDSNPSTDDVDGLFSRTSAGYDVAKAAQELIRAVPNEEVNPVARSRSVGAADKALKNKGLLQEEFFKVKFDLLSETEEEQLLIKENETLKESLIPFLQERGLRIEQIEAVLEASTSPLPLDCQTFQLKESLVHIRAKDESGSVPTSAGIVGGLVNRRGCSLDQGNAFLNPALAKRVSGPNAKMMQRTQSGLAPSSMGGVGFRPSASASQLMGGSSVSVSATLPTSMSSAGLPSSGGPRSGRSASRPSPHDLNNLLYLSEESSRHRAGTEDDEASTRGKKSGSVFDDGATFDVSPSGTMSKGSYKNKLNQKASIAKEKGKLERLNEMLGQWETNGLPEMPALMDTVWPQINMDDFDIPKNCQFFISVEEREALSKKQWEQQEAIWELLSTECEFIRALKLVHDLYLSCLLNAQLEGILNEVKSESLFANISALMEVNCNLWKNDMVRVIDTARENKALLDPTILKDAFLNFRQPFLPYIEYCSKQEACSKYARTLQDNNSLFKTFLVWAESQKQCNKLVLNDWLVKPMKRLTHYLLILKTVHKKTLDTDMKEELLEMITHVDKFVTEVDYTLAQNSNREEMTKINARIEAYDAVDFSVLDTANVRDLSAKYAVLDLLTPMPSCGPTIRRLMREGPVKLKEAGSRSDVHFLLFTDLLLITKLKPKTQSFRILKAPMKLDRLHVVNPKDSTYFGIIHTSEHGQAQALYLVQTDDNEEWKKSFRKAKIDFAKQLSNAAESEAGRAAAAAVAKFAREAEEEEIILNATSVSRRTPGAVLGKTRSLPRDPTGSGISLTTSNETNDGDNGSGSDDSPAGPALHQRARSYGNGEELANVMNSSGVSPAQSDTQCPASPRPARRQMSMGMNYQRDISVDSASYMMEEPGTGQNHRYVGGRTRDSPPSSTSSAAAYPTHSVSSGSSLPNCSSTSLSPGMQRQPGSVSSSGVPVRRGSEPSPLSAIGAVDPVVFDFGPEDDDLSKDVGDDERGRDEATRKMAKRQHQQRRHVTTDAIPNLHPQANKDTSIYKRLSMHVPTGGGESSPSGGHNSNSGSHYGNQQRLSASVYHPPPLANQQGVLGRTSHDSLRSGTSGESTSGAGSLEVFSEMEDMSANSSGNGISPSSSQRRQHHANNLSPTSDMSYVPVNNNRLPGTGKLSPSAYPISHSDGVTMGGGSTLGGNIMSNSQDAGYSGYTGIARASAVVLPRPSSASTLLPEQDGIGTRVNLNFSSANGRVPIKEHLLELKRHEIARLTLASKSSGSFVIENEVSLGEV